MGPTAAILNPYPRDYRQGLYKFKSTERAAKPTHADLERILRDGIMDTAMPSFDLLLPSEIASLVEYVKYLSLRGEMEHALVLAVADLSEGDHLPQDREGIVDELFAPIVKKWREADQRVISPPAPPQIAQTESEKLGRELFYSAKAGCVKCHGGSALGDGQVADFDDWNKRVAEALKANRAALAALEANHDLAPAERAKRLARLTATADALESEVLPPLTIRPRNLRRPYYHFGRRPIDLYRRVSAGVNGAPMPGAGQATPGAPGLTPDEIWSVVHYLQSLPYEGANHPPRDATAAARAEF
jgi:mono/diheme cytochrome c family protein